MNRDGILQKLRDAWRAGDVAHMESLLRIGSWFLTSEDKVKVQSAIYELKNKRTIDPLVLYACQVLGGHIVQDED